MRALAPLKDRARDKICVKVISNPHLSYPKVASGKFVMRPSQLGASFSDRFNIVLVSSSPLELAIIAHSQACTQH